LWADLSYPDDHGVTKYERLSHLEEVTQQPHIPEIDIPIDALYLWDWFMNLNYSRPSGMGISPITYSELKAWTELTGVQLSHWEVDVIKRLDNKVVEVVGALQSKKIQTKRSSSEPQPTKRVM